MKELPPIPNVDPQKEAREKRELAGIPPRGEASAEQRELTQYISEWWQGDVHSHSVMSTREETGSYDGLYSINEIMGYYEKLGLRFVAFAEHTSDPGNPRKLSVDDPISQSLLEEIDEIEKINRGEQFEIVGLSSVEANVIFDDDGEPIIDTPDEILAKLDLVVASRHAIANEKEPEEIKKSLLAAIRNESVDVIGHPDRYTRKDREKSPEYWAEYWEIWPEILDEMVAQNKAFEINLSSQPSRKLLAMAVKSGVKFSLSLDAHDFNQFKSGGTEVHGEKQRWAADEASDEDMEILQKYKMDRMTSGPGVRIIVRLVKYLRTLEALGVTPDKVINSSLENLVNFLTKDRGKTTNNLKLLEERFNEN